MNRKWFLFGSCLAQGDVWCRRVACQSWGGAGLTVVLACTKINFH